jgi:hypothetical protein
MNGIKLYPKRDIPVFISEKNDMDQLKKHFVITGVDKEPNKATSSWFPV